MEEASVSGPGTLRVKLTRTIPPSLGPVLTELELDAPQVVTLAELAEVASASPSHFKALFKQSVGLPVHQYVVRCRVEFAMERLLMDDPPLSDLALQAGFANASHLARWMRRIAGVTPSVLKRNAD